MGSEVPPVARTPPVWPVTRRLKGHDGAQVGHFGEPATCLTGDMGRGTLMNTGVVSFPELATVTLKPLPRDVEDRLRALGPGLTGVTALILPTQTRSGRTYYLADDVEAVRAARTVGLQAGYLDSPEERRYLNEFAASWELETALAVAQNLTVNGISAVIAYVWERVRIAIQRGRHPGPEVDVPVRLTIAQLERDGVKVKGFEFVGPAEGATTLLNTVLGSPATARAQLFAGSAVPVVSDEDGETAAR